MALEKTLLAILRKTTGGVVSRAGTLTAATNTRLYGGQPTGLYVIAHPSTRVAGGWLPRYVGQSANVRERMVGYYRDSWVLSANPGRLRVWLALVRVEEQARRRLETQVVRLVNQLLAQHRLPPLLNTAGAAEAESELEFVSALW